MNNNANNEAIVFEFSSYTFLLLES